ncbi:GyrI-like domain-containing protein [Amycolatopsis keratiniphila]|uniref:GyrI-like domain-containing protein n=1 Tax=Amycolatopsis keratiniphila TaxID=129921 RepID=UPI0033FE8C98
MTYAVELTELDSIDAAHLRCHTTTADIGESVGMGLDALYTFVSEAGTTPNGPPQAAYPGDFQPGEELDLDLYLPVSGGFPSQGDIDIVTLDGGPAARTSHHGPYDKIGAAYEAVYEWVRESGRQSAGAPRELYLCGPDSTPDPADYITDVVLPLRNE